MRRPVILVPVGMIAFTAAWIALGAVSPGYDLFGHTIAPYSWVSQPVSGLGLGVTGPWMNTAFVICGTLLAVGTWSTVRSWHGRLRTTAMVLISLMGVGMIICGLFPLTAIMLHLVGFLVAVPLPAVGLVLAGVSWRRTSRRLALVGILGGALALVLFVAFQATFDASGAGGNVGFSGLLQRALILVAMAGVGAVTVGGSDERLPAHASRRRKADGSHAASAAHQ